MQNKPLLEVRCYNCGKTIGKARLGGGCIEIKCKSCKRTTAITVVDDNGPEPAGVAAADKQ